MADVNLTLDLRMEVTEQTTHRVRKYGFGDGYEAVSKDGINTRQTEYSVTTEPIKDATTQTTFISDLDKVATVIISLQLSHHLAQSHVVTG